ncbi:DUF3048 domain-containing protein [Peribacillus loiseleuriae]|uniref:Lipoprotein YerB n=1 Tax=Peribacillus loiseleuriae TaxID=1679170 RepID=A0A0K9GQ52_9BACI|nr:DUF3048 domain-containing protein [Peribacillus loiseleuriae]KMY48392.1 lipoprotein YerB [Peribacillus loiseleuriae]
MKKSLPLILFAVLLLMSGCLKKEAMSERPIDNSSSEIVGQDETTQEPDDSDQYTNIFPLTGIATNDDTEHRAIAVMINNHPRARPQSGLSKADIVYEMYAEAEVTRFLAVFQSEMPKEVGPVRSARDYFIKLAKGLDCVYVCHGNSPDAKEMLDQGYIDHLNGLEYDGTLFKRSSERKAPHNSYISFENIERGAEQNSYDLTKKPKAFTFLEKSEMELLQGEPASFVQISYGASLFDVEFLYDEQSETYSRYSNNQQTIEYEDEVPIKIDNIFIIEAPHKVIDSVGRRDIDFNAGGKAYLLQKGKWNEIQWKNSEGRIVPVENGKEVGFVPGKTWVNVLPDKPGISQLVHLGAQEN